MFHEQLYRYHVLQEHSLPDPGYPPYYDKIQHYKETSPMNISIMSTKEWYTTLLADQVLMHPTNDDDQAFLILVRPDNLNLNCKWP